VAEMHQATERGFDTNEVVLHGLMPVTGSRRLNCYAVPKAFYHKSMKNAIQFYVFVIKLGSCYSCGTLFILFLMNISINNGGFS